MSELRAYWRERYVRSYTRWIVETPEKWVDSGDEYKIRTGFNSSYGDVDPVYKRIPYLRLFLMLGDDVKRHL